LRFTFLNGVEGERERESDGGTRDDYGKCEQNKQYNQYTGHAASRLLLCSAHLRYLTSLTKNYPKN